MSFADTSGKKNTQITEAELERQCKSIEASWRGSTDIDSALTWMENVMEEQGAQYAYQKPISKSVINYYFAYDGSPAINDRSITHLIVETFRNLNPYIPEPLDDYKKYVKEIKYLHEKYGGSTVSYPELVNNTTIVAGKVIDPSHFAEYWKNKELNEPPAYIGDILNQYEIEKGKKSSWTFIHSEWREPFTYIYSRFLRTVEPQDIDLYINYSFDFFARRNQEGHLEDVKLQDLRCVYGRYDEVESAARGMPPATEPTKPLPPFYGGSCSKYEKWLGCHKIKNVFIPLRYGGTEDFCQHIPPEEPVCEESQ